MVRRITIAACKVVPESEAEQKPEYEQMNLFTDYNLQDPAGKEEEERLQKEKALQLAELQIRERFGRNAIIKGTSLQKGATGRERNAQIGGHRA